MSLRQSACFGVLALMIALPAAAGSGNQQHTIRAVDQPVSAPELALQDLNGKQQRLSDKRGKVVAVNFWATWCPPCRKELPSMQQTYQEFEDQGFEIMAVNVGEDWDTVAPFLENFSVTFPVLLDSKSEAIQRWKVLGLPTTFLVDAEGNITHRINGGRDWNDPEFRKQLGEIIQSH